MGRRLLFVGFLFAIAFASMGVESAPAWSSAMSNEAGRVPDEPLDKQPQPGDFRLLRVYYRVFRFRDWSASTQSIDDRIYLASLKYGARFAFETVIDNYREIFLSVPSPNAGEFLEWTRTDFVRDMKESYPRKWEAHEFASELMDSDLIMHVKFKFPWWKSVNAPPFSISPWGLVRPNRTHSLQPAFACGAKPLLSFLLNEADSPLTAQARDELRNRMGENPAPGKYELLLKDRKIDLRGFEKPCPGGKN